MRKYTVQIDFNNERHCMNCPLISPDDYCNMQDDEMDDMRTWDDQMKNCPLREVEDK